MAHQAWPSVILLLTVSTLFYQLQSVRGQQIDRNTLLSIRETVTNIELKEIWSNQFKHAVKRTDPSFLRAKKRWKRSELKVRLKAKKSRVPMPAALLTNARSFFRKLDELFGLVNGPRMREIICVTETWLQPHIPTAQSELSGFAQFHIDRDLIS